MDNFNIPSNGAIMAIFMLFDDDEIMEQTQYLFEEWSNYDPDKDPRELLYHEIYYMAAMLMDGVLPKKGAQALGGILMGAMKEIKEKKYSVDILKSYPPKPGRKEDKKTKLFIITEVMKRLNLGMMKMDAYEEVAVIANKSVVHIRRTWEERENRRKARENKKVENKI